jgi:hypothetical protein
MPLAVVGPIIWLMTNDKVKRRLTTVLCADVQGYSRLMEADEAGTLGTLAATALPLQDWWSAMTGGAGRPREVEGLAWPRR